MVYGDEMPDALVGVKGTPIMLRAAISEREWATIRKRAIDAKLTTAEYVARLLRKGLANDGR